MFRLRRFVATLLNRGTAPPGNQIHDDLEPDPDFEGLLDPNTAALMEGAPPAGAGGRTQPSGSSPDPRPPRGPGEGEVQNLPG